MSLLEEFEANHMALQREKNLRGGAGKVSEIYEVM